MKTNTTYKKPILKGVLALLFTLICLSSVLLLQFTLRYKEDIFSHNIDTSSFITLLFLAFLTLAPLITPFAILASGLIYSQARVQYPFQGINSLIKKTLPFILFIGSLFFIEKCFVLPQVDLRMASLLFDIRMKDPNKPMERTSLTLFKDNSNFKNYFELSDLSDTLRKNQLEYKTEAISQIREYANTEEIKSILLTAEAKKIGLAHDDFKSTNTAEQWKDSRTNNNLSSMLSVIAMKIEELKTEDIDINLTRAEIITYPFAIIIMFYIGFFIGVLLRKWMYPAIMLVILLFTALPIQYGLYIISIYLAKAEVLSPFKAQFSYIIVLLFIATIIWAIARSSKNDFEENISET